MSEFERAMPNTRLVQTHHGDDLRAVALRELGDANRWAELVWINRLVPPYLTDDAGLVTDGVLRTGSALYVPAPAGIAVPDADRAPIFERDCRLTDGLLSVAVDGDLAVVGGVDNLRQQLVGRINTRRGALRGHPEYGSRLWSLQGKVNGPTVARLGAEYVKADMGAEYRVSRVLQATAEVVGDRVMVTGRCEAVDGQRVDVVVGAVAGGGDTPGTSAGWGNDYGNNYGN